MATLGVNCYTTLDEADEYFLNQLHNADWLANAPATQPNIHEEALVTASGILNRIQWQGTCAPTSALPLAWPRNITTFVPLNGADVSLTDDRETVTNPVGGTIPQFVKDATCELALYLIRNRSTLESNETGASPVRDLTVGSIRLTFDLSERFRRGYTDLPDIVRSIIAPYVSDSGNTIFVNGGA